MTVKYSPDAYLASVLIAAAVCVALCVGARRRPGPWVVVASRSLAVLLLAEAVSWQLGFLLQRDWTVGFSLPLDLCDMATLVAAAACWWRTQALVEVTWFWGLAGCLQAIITPDVGGPFPDLGFINYVVEHNGIVVAAIFLVVGLRLTPRPGAVWRVYLLTVAYAAVVGTVDAVTGGNYLYLRALPPAWSLLSVMGPWPLYILGAAAVGAFFFVVLDAPFFLARRAARRAARRVETTMGGGAEAPAT